MMNEYPRERTLTVGELAQAISAGHVSYSRQDGCYVVTHRAARHLAEESARETLDQPSSEEPQDCSTTLCPAE
jgi:hypothetical protein